MDSSVRPRYLLNRQLRCGQEAETGDARRPGRAEQFWCVPFAPSHTISRSPLTFPAPGWGGGAVGSGGPHHCLPADPHGIEGKRRRKKPAFLDHFLPSHGSGGSQLCASPSALGWAEGELQPCFSGFFWFPQSSHKASDTPLSQQHKVGRIAILDAAGRLWSPPDHLFAV